ncbi:hypothetical protein CPH92_03765 [Malaciobacter marinus]|nr:hypothetical protein CPH92_03765 [Malaciobacter marinus]
MNTLLLASLSSTLFANDVVKLEDITVTAQKKKESKQEIALSLDILNSKDIKEQKILDTEDIVNSTPGLFMIKTNHHGTAGFLSLRGITPTMEGEQSIGFFVDDIYYPMFDSEILDIKRVEVLKGPQGTLYGKNTESGVINIITNKPVNENSGNIEFGLANNNTQEYKALVNTKLIDNEVFLRAALRKYKSDGYFENKYNNNKKSDHTDGIDGRVALRYLPTDNLDFILSYDRNDYENGYSGFNTLNEVLKNPGKVNVDFDGKGEFKNDKFALKSIYENENLTFTSITAASNTKNIDYNDLDFTTNDLMRLKTNRDIDFLSQEFRVNSSYKNLKYLIGGYFSKEDNKESVDFEMRQANPLYGMPKFTKLTSSDDSTNNYALFSQANYAFNSFFDVTLGLRYDKEHKDYKYKVGYDKDLSMFGMIKDSIKKSKSSSQVLPKVSFNFNFEKHLLYASYTKGYKAGGYNSLAPINNQEFEDELSNNFEIGLKSRFLNDRLFTNLAIYQIYIDDQQVEQQYYPDSITSNAGKSEIKGLDLDITYQATDKLVLSAGIGYNDSKFDEYKDNILDGSGNIIGQKDYSGKRAPNTPKYTYNITAKYNFLADTYILAKLNGVGDIYYNLDNSVKQKSYELVDLSFGTSFNNCDIRLWSKNIFDKTYTTRAFEMNNEWYARAGEGRTFGFELAYKF